MLEREERENRERSSKSILAGTKSLAKGAEVLVHSRDNEAHRKQRINPYVVYDIR